VRDHVQPTGWPEAGEDDKLFKNITLGQQRDELQNWKVSQIEKLHQRLPFLQNYEAILHAAQWNAVLVKFLKNAASTVNANLQDKDGWTALIRAAYKGHTEVVKLLLAPGTNVNLQNIRGLTALMHASFKGHTKVVELLLKAHVDVNLQDQYGMTALMHASDDGRTKVVELLLEAHADVSLQDQDGWTALICATAKGHTEVVE
jgi:ankyrin repeat protein